MQQFDVLQNEIPLDLDDPIREYDYKTSLPEFVFVLLGVTPKVAETALGKYGRRLVELINMVDLNHPDLPYVIHSIFCNDAAFMQQVQDVLDLAERCKHLSSISHNFHKLVDRHKFSTHFLSTKFGSRLWKSKRDLEASRRNRKVQKVNLSSVYRKGTEVWNNQPDNFKVYNRYNMPYLHEIELSERKLDRYEELGCQDIVDKVSAQIRQLRINLSYRYSGFNRLSMSVAAVILARMHNYKFKVAWDIHDNRTANIIVPPVLLYEYQPKESEIPGVFASQTLGSCYYYEPRAYPVHQLLVNASDAMLKVVEHLDNFPDMNGRPLFDDLLVLVPSVKLQSVNGTYFVKDHAGNILGFNSEEEAALFLDKTLMDNGFVHPVLLGERDGMCYFTCYWR